MSVRKALILVNETAGHSTKDEMLAAFHESLESLPLQAEIVTFSKSDDFVEVCRRNIQKAKDQDSLFVISGGDGTINSAVGLCHDLGVPLGIVPQGTFNYFARSLEIPVTMREALQNLIDGTPRDVVVGKVNDHFFINNASFGLYTRLIENRERDKAKFGRLRPVAFISAVLSLFRDQQKFTVALTSSAKSSSLATTMVFVGLNSLQLDNLGLTTADCTRKGSFGVITLKAMGRWRTLKFLFNGLIGRLNAEDNIDQYCADSLEAGMNRKSMKVAIDGEIISCTTPLVFSLVPGGVSVIAPRPVANS